MLKWVKPSTMSLQEVMWLAKSLEAAPGYERRDLEEFLTSVYLGEIKVFHVGLGLIAAKVSHGADGSRRLTVMAFAGKPHLREAVAGMKRLAADWECDTIETCVYDQRLAHAILKASGGKVESLNLALEV